MVGLKGHRSVAASASPRTTPCLSSGWTRSPHSWRSSRAGSDADGSPERSRSQVGGAPSFRRASAAGRRDAPLRGAGPRGEGDEATLRRGTPGPSNAGSRRPLRRRRSEWRPRRLGRPGPKATRACDLRGRSGRRLPGGNSVGGRLHRRRSPPPRSRRRDVLPCGTSETRVAFGPGGRQPAGGRAATSCPQGASSPGPVRARDPRRHPAAHPFPRGRAARSGATHSPAARALRAEGAPLSVGPHEEHVRRRPERHDASKSSIPARTSTDARRPSQRFRPTVPFTMSPTSLDAVGVATPPMVSVVWNQEILPVSRVPGMGAHPIWLQALCPPPIRGP